MNVARLCRADEFKVRLCFFVKVRKASGRKVGGGSSIGRTVGIDGLNAGGGGGGRACAGRIGWAGVQNAGEDDKATLSPCSRGSLSIPVWCNLLTSTFDLDQS